MMIDIVCVSALIFFAALGAWRGFLRQVTSLAAVILIALFAVPLGVRIAESIGRGEAWTPTHATNMKIALSLAAAAAIYVAVKVLGAIANRTLGRTAPEEGEPRRPAPWNRYWGAALAVLKAGTLCWLVLCFFVAFPRITPGAAARAGESWSVGTTKLFNPFERWIGPETRTSFEDALITLWKLKQKPDAWRAAVREESVQRVLQHERIRTLLDEGHGDLVGALADEDFRKSLAAIDWDEVASAARRAESHTEQ